LPTVDLFFLVRTASPGQPLLTDGARSISLPVMSTRLLLPVSTAVIFLGAFLLFLVQPMMAKLLLPAYGGSPAVWTTAMLFFQLLLLAGYLYAHAASSRGGRRLHLVLLLLVLMLLPVGLPAGLDVNGLAPPGGVLLVLALMIGLPFMVLSATSPLLQRWFSQTDHPTAKDPYYLYAAGNAGSLLALLAYPLLIEPNWRVSEQLAVWSGAYVLFAAGCLGLAIISKRRAVEEDPTPETETTAVVSRLTSLRWIAYAFIASSLLTAVTTHISTDVAAMPLLWVLPLALYLLSFIVAFSRRAGPYSVGIGAGLLLATFPLVAISFFELSSLPVVALIGLHLTALLAVALLAHGRLARERPAPSQLTRFYLLIAVGGAAGGVFNALLAPLLFDGPLEYPLTLLASLLLLPAVRLPWRSLLARLPVPDVSSPALLLLAILMIVAAAIGLGLPQTAILPSTVILAAAGMIVLWPRPRAYAIVGVALLLLSGWGEGTVLYADRTFFGSYQVADSEGAHYLTHGTTVHGIQRNNNQEPLAYYYYESGIGRLLAQSGPFDNVALVGLGSGALAAYGQEGQNYTFYEIDAAMDEIASDTRLFSYLASSEADISVVIADGRIGLADSDEQYNLIVLDAFSSDAIPAHLLTREAIAIYLQRLTPDGVLAFHISNRYLDLEPVLAGAAADHGLAAAIYYSDGDEESLKYSSIWVVMSREQRRIDELDGWQSLTPHQLHWTDQFSDIVSILR